MGFGSRLELLFGRFTYALNGLGTLGILAMMVFINIDVLGRSLFNHPIPGVAEFVGLAIVAIVWAQAASTLRRHRFVRSDIFLGRLERRHPRLGLAMHLVFNLNGLVISGIIFYFSIPLLTQAVEQGFYRGTFGVVTLPVWPVKVIILVGCAALFLQFLSFLVFGIRELLGGTGSRRP